MEIKWSTYAKEDLQDFYNYTKMLHPKEYINNLVKYINDNLSKNPKLGRIYNYINKLKLNFIENFLK